MPTNSLERAFAVLEALESAPGGLTNAELCRQFDMASSTCSYITARLEKRGYLRRDPATRRYRMGLKTIALARSALRDLGFRSIAEPVLYRLTAETGLSAGIGVLQGTSVLLVDRVDGPDVVEGVVSRGAPQSLPRENREVGRELPLHSTALGKVLLAYLPAVEQAPLISQLTLARFTPATLTAKPAFAHHLSTVREQGYALADQEHYVGIRAISAPVFDSARRVRAAVSLNGDISANVWRSLPALVSQVESAAREISKHSRFLWFKDIPD